MDHAHIGREATAELVAQPQSGLERAQARTDAALLVLTAVELELDQWLQDQAIGQQHVVLGFHIGRDAAGGADIGGGLNLELVRRQALQADREPVLRTAGFEVVLGADHHVPPGRDAAAVERFEVRRPGDAAFALALAAQPQAVEIAAEPSRGLPGLTAAVIGIADFQAVEQHVGIELARVLHVLTQRRERRGAVGVGERRNRFARGLARGGRVSHRGVIHLGMVHACVVAAVLGRSLVAHLRMVHALVLATALGRSLMAHRGVIHLGMVLRRFGLRRRLGRRRLRLSGMCAMVLRLRGRRERERQGSECGATGKEEGAHSSTLTSRIMPASM